MGLFSRKKNDSNEFEIILSKLDKDIQHIEGRLSEIKIKQRKASFLWTIYSVVIWAIFLFYLIYKVMDIDSTTQDLIQVFIPVLVVPVCVYHVRKILLWWYDSRQKNQENKLAKLRKEQKNKLEDLKKKTSYYKTQSLLEKYDAEIIKKKKEQEQLLQQKLKPVSVPARKQNYQPNSIQMRVLGPQMTNHHQHKPIQMHTEPQWYDKIVDALVGEIGPETKYAVICNHCYSHNGLVFIEEYYTIQYICPVCKQFNPPRKSSPHKIQPKKQEVDKKQEDSISSKPNGTE